MTPTTIALLCTGAAGMLGWFVAWRTASKLDGKSKELAAAVAGEVAAKQMVLESNARAATSETLHQAEKSRADGVSLQLDSERKRVQALLDALAKSGVAVGPTVVDSVLDQLYTPGGGPGAGSGASGNSPGVSGVGAVSSAKTTTGR